MRDNEPLETTQTDDADDLFGAIPGRDSISSLLADDIVFVEPTASVRDAAKILRAADVGLAVVGEGGNAVGVVSERDIVRAVARGDDLDTTVVDVVETDDLRWSMAESSVDDVAEEMLENHLRHVLVRHDDGSLAGVVSMRDLLGAYLP